MRIRGWLIISLIIVIMIIILCIRVEYILGFVIAL